MLKNIDCGCSLEPPREGGSNEYTRNLCFEQKYEKYQNFKTVNLFNLAILGGCVFPWSLHIYLAISMFMFCEKNIYKHFICSNTEREREGTSNTDHVYTR